MIKQKIGKCSECDSNAPEQPLIAGNANAIIGNSALQNDTSLGLTKREYFAGLAMQGLISSCDWNVTIFNKDLIEATSKNAIELADELLKQLEDD